MFNLPNLNERTVFPWLSEFETQVANKFSALNKKIAEGKTDEIEKEIESIQSAIEALPGQIKEALFPVGVVLLRTASDAEARLAEIYGGEWTGLLTNLSGVYAYGRIR